jgi:hypothetical protein
MSSLEHVEETEDDRMYLSFFEVTKTCPSGSKTTWREWIEPLTMHSRHPDAFLKRGVNILYADYVLFESAAALHQQGRQNVKHYLFDAGAQY